MKKNLILAGLGIFFASCATEMNILSSDVPQTVQAAFKAKYPDAHNVEWEVEKEEDRLLFEAEWKDGTKEREASFRPDGSFVKEE